MPSQKSQTYSINNADLFILGNTFGFAEDKDILTFNSDYFVDSSFVTQSSKTDSATDSLTSDLNSESQNDSLRTAHKYIGYATAALVGVTAATSSSIVVIRFYLIYG
jgi:hypothetical protein